MLYSQNKKVPLIISPLVIFLLLTACGGEPVKPVVEKKVESTPVVVTPLEPEAETVAITLAPASQVETRKIEPIKPQPKPVVTAIVKPDSSKIGKPIQNKDSLKALIASKSAASKAAKAPASKVDIKRKLSFTRMMLMTKSGRKITESDNYDAKAILVDVKAKVDRAESLMNGGDLKGADEALGEAMRLFNSAARMIPSEDLKAEQKAKFPKLKNEIEVSRDLHKRNYDKITAKHGMAAGIAFSEDEVQQLIAEADRYASQDDYTKANESLEAARNVIQHAIREMMSGRKIVYELNIDTPKGEYEYELNKYIGYEELIPIAIEKKKPNKGLLMLVNRHHEKANWMADEARKQAEQGGYPKAIRMLQDATTEIRKALKIMGVPSIG